MKTEKSKPCDKHDGDPNHTFEVAHGNSDAKCFREKEGYSQKVVKKNPKICIGCVYNSQNS